MSTISFSHTFVPCVRKVTESLCGSSNIGRGIEGRNRLVFPLGSQIESSSDLNPVRPICWHQQKGLDRHTKIAVPYPPTNTSPAMVANWGFGKTALLLPMRQGSFLFTGSCCIYCLVKIDHKLIS